MDFFCCFFCKLILHYVAGLVLYRATYIFLYGKFQWNCILTHFDKFWECIRVLLIVSRLSLWLCCYNEISNNMAANQTLVLTREIYLTRPNEAFRKESYHYLPKWLYFLPCKFTLRNVCVWYLAFSPGTEITWDKAVNKIQCHRYK